MKLERTAVTGSVIGLMVLTGCTNPPPNGPTPQVAKDSEVRTWIRDDLAPYLSAIAKQLCALQLALAPQTPLEETVCTGDPEGYKPPPPNGNP